MDSNVYLIYGNDEYAVATKADALVRAQVPPADRALGLETVDGAVDNVEGALQALDQCLGALLTTGMFQSSKVVWFKNVNFLTDTAVGRSESVKTRLARLADTIAKGLPDGNSLVVSAGGADKRYAFYKACKSAGQIIDCALPAAGRQTERETTANLRDFAAARNLKLPADVQAAFIEKTGGNTRQMICELDKLAAYVGQRSQVRMEDIRAIVSSSRESPAWDLADAVGKRELGRALELTRQLLFQKESGIRLIITIESRIRDLMIYKEGLQRRWLQSSNSNLAATAWRSLPDEVESIFSGEMERDPRKTHPYRAGLLAQQAQKFSRAELKRGLQLAVAAREQLVSSATPESIVLEATLIDMLA